MEILLQVVQAVLGFGHHVAGNQALGQLSRRLGMKQMIFGLFHRQIGDVAHDVLGMAQQRLLGCHVAGRDGGG